MWFKATTTENDDGWQMMYCGVSNQDNHVWVVTTHQLHADEVPEESMDAKSTAVLVAQLLNEYYAKKNNRQIPLFNEDTDI